MKTFFNYLKNSGITIGVILNPFGWNYIPRFVKTTDPWNDDTFIFSFLFLHISMFITDGGW